MKYQPTPRDLFNPPPQAAENTHIEADYKLKDRCMGIEHFKQFCEEIGRNWRQYPNVHVFLEFAMWATGL